MTIAKLLRRCTSPAVALCAVAALLVAGPAAPALAAPSGSATDDEGGTKELRAKLDAAVKGYTTAKNNLDSSKKRQAEYTAALKAAEQRLSDLTAHVQELAATAYRTGRLNGFTMLLNSASPDDFLSRVVTVDMLARQDDRQLREYTQAQDDAKRQKELIDNEVKVQIKQLADMAKKKKEAEQALAAAGGGSPSGGLTDADSPLAQPAPRNADGSWPTESCSVNDPTTSGCITPRTLHAMQQAKADGFTRYVSCFRSGGEGEHPKGRACDFSAAAGGFEDVNATGGDKAYGDRLAAYFVKNANRLGVMYVIWYAQIWMPGTGWSTYSGSGSPAATHKNHVHLSML